MTIQELKQAAFELDPWAELAIVDLAKRFAASQVERIDPIYRPCNPREIEEQKQAILKELE